MAFTQFTLDKATNQARGIFDQYVYSTSDSIATTQAAGYFLQSRFIDDPDWVGSLITCKCSDGIYEGEIQSSGTVTPIPIDDTEIIVEISSFPYTHLGSEDIIICTGTGTINMISAASANKSFSIVSKTGTITMNPDGGDSIQQATITSGNALSTTPETAGWVSI